MSEDASQPRGADAEQNDADVGRATGPNRDGRRTPPSAPTPTPTPTPSVEGEASDAAAAPLERVRRWVAWLPLVVATLALMRMTVRAIYAKVGHPGAVLDDAYIHFQYARAIAEGHPFRFQAGEPISTGATSFAWPALLALPYLAGIRGEQILWVTWILSYLALAALAYETYLLTVPLAGRGAAIGAAAMTLSFGGLAWGAASGMEVVPFAWVLAHGARRASDWVEQPARRTSRELRWLVAIALLAPLVRPEGVILSLLLGAAVVAYPRAHRAEALAFPLAALTPNLLLFALTGHATSSTAQVKLLFGNPYFDVTEATLSNARLLVGTILDGDVWSAEFLPRGGAPFAFAGLAALVWRGGVGGRWFRAGAVLVLALSMFVPCVYVTFLWNRLRYLWPFAPAWFVGLACLSRALGSIVSRVDLRGGVATTTLVAGAFAGTLAVRLEWVIEDVAQSASGIDRQQAALGRWASQNLPPDARIGVNDTGAIAYFGNRRTFDIVGLTTPSEGRYWVAGAGSRLEHYERLRISSPSSLPTHFIVYPEWMGCDAVLGRALHEAVVTDSTILGGQIMRAYEARWDLLGSGEKPWTTTGSVVDTVDVADLESEAEHHYELLGARDGEEVATESNAPNSSILIDGGRTHRIRERFVAKLPEGRAAIGIGRVEVTTDNVCTLHIQVGGREVHAERVEPGGWTEIRFAVPAEMAHAATPIEVIADGSVFTSYHWWFSE